MDILKFWSKIQVLIFIKKINLYLQVFNFDRHIVDIVKGNIEKDELSQLKNGDGNIF